MYIYIATKTAASSSNYLHFPVNERPLLKLVFVTKRLHSLFNGALVCPSSGVPGHCYVLLGKTLNFLTVLTLFSQVYKCALRNPLRTLTKCQGGGKIYDAGGQHNSFFTACYDKLRRSRTAGAKLFLRNCYILNDQLEPREYQSILILSCSN